MSDDSDACPRQPGCQCTWEEGDSACPVHPTCWACGAVLEDDNCDECDEVQHDAR